MWQRADRALLLHRVAWAAVRQGTATFLLSAALFSIDAICLRCTTVHVLTVLTFGTTLHATVTYPPPVSVCA